MLAWSVEGFDASPEIARTVLVVAPAEATICTGLLASLRLRKPVAVVEGGETRHQSEFNGVESLAPQILDGSVARVLVHDAARPFVDPALIIRLLQALGQSPGAIPALPAPAALVQGLDTGRLQAFVRDAWGVQTPQAFQAHPLLEAHRRANADGFQGSDTASVVERTGQAVAVLEGNPDTFKITTPIDLVRAQIVARRRMHSTGGG